MDRYKAIIILLIIAFVVGVLGAGNVFGIGDAMAGAGGAVAGGFIGLLAGFLTWGGAGGGPTAGVVYLSVMIVGFILGGLIMKGVNKVRSKQAPALGPLQSSPQQVIPISQMQSEPAAQQTPAPPPEPKKEEEVKATV